MQARARLWQCAVLAVAFDRAVRAMAPALTASIIPLLPVVSHFAFDFESRCSLLFFDPLTCRVPPMTAPIRSLLNTKWFESVSQNSSNKRKLD
jgi:hypothetical protein